MSTVIAQKPTTARWNNTGGDVTIHIVPTGTALLVEPTQEEVWAFNTQTTTPVCGRGIFHGSWTWIPKQVAPLTLCPGCFPEEAQAHVQHVLGLQAAANGHVLDSLKA